MGLEFVLVARFRAMAAPFGQDAPRLERATPEHGATTTLALKPPARAALMRHVQMTRLVWLVAILIVLACLVFAAAES